MSEQVLAARVQQLARQLESVQDAVTLSLEMMRQRDAAVARADTAERKARELQRLLDGDEPGEEYRRGYLNGYRTGRRGSDANPQGTRRTHRNRRLKATA